MRKLLFIFLLITNNVHSQTDPGYKLIAGHSYVQSKNYYLLTLLQELPDANKLIASDSVLAHLAVAKSKLVNEALKEITGYTTPIKFTPEEITQVSDRLKQLYKADNALGKLVSKHLIPSGTYILYKDLNGADLLAKAWTQDAEGVNYAIAVYAEGQKPNYPLIDSISIQRNGAIIYNTISLAVREKNPHFFSLPLTAALHFIEINEREQAADFEPMTEGENKAALARIKTIKWDAYKYSVILVPGAGPDDPGVPFSAEGMVRCRLAALQYQQGAAPFIMVSGGKVHPYKTKYCEATEMKQYLINKLHIPPNAIIIEPHARHTTTNMRNGARLMYRYGIPFGKAALTCTTRGQSGMIEKTLIARCMKEIGIAPYKLGSRLSETEVEFYPLADALQINPGEPLDP
jgi:hypothetical protein